jgi:haloacetate dehalogenase
MRECLRCYQLPNAIHAVSEDYRAAAGIDLEQDAQDDRAGKRIEAPILALWGAKGTVGKLYDVLETWRDKAVQVSGKAFECGHLLPEEDPGSTLSELKKFFGAS